eukprot:TRINITY_DN18185_c0_g1_i1.p1 TRINITY_DN18185_c0_g1~~TRINITY_DN18185_c0_g1_i1.p1  ORF type:complete len:308 (+),score=47.32 TRINITY_DN18185_c0_g1_i1:24-947(+)
MLSLRRTGARPWAMSLASCGRERHASHALAALRSMVPVAADPSVVRLPLLGRHSNGLQPLATSQPASTSCVTRQSLSCLRGLTAGRRGIGSAASSSSALREDDEELIKDAPRQNYMPEWAKQESQPPLRLRLLGAAMLAPLGLGAVAVHALARGDGDAVSDARSSGDESAEYSRVLLSWNLHYAGVLLAFAGAAHWGMQLAEFGVPLRSDNMGLYYLCRFSAPIVFVLFGWLGSVLSVADSWEAVMWLLTGYIGLLSCDFVAKAFYVAPPWWFRWRAGFTLGAVVSLLLILLSERNVYLGPKPKIQM